MWGLKGCKQWSLCKPTGSTLNAPTGCLFNAQRAEPKWTEGKEIEKEWGTREIETSLNPTQAQLQPLAHYPSSKHLSGAMVYKHICKLISNQSGTQA